MDGARAGGERAPAARPAGTRPACAAFVCYAVGLGLYALPVLVEPGVLDLERMASSDLLLWVVAPIFWILLVFFSWRMLHHAAPAAAGVAVARGILALPGLALAGFGLWFAVFLARWAELDPLALGWVLAATLAVTAEILLIASGIRAFVVWRRGRRPRVVSPG